MARDKTPVKEDKKKDKSDKSDKKEKADKKEKSSKSNPVAVSAPGADIFAAMGLGPAVPPPASTSSSKKDKSDKSKKDKSGGGDTPKAPKSEEAPKSDKKEKKDTSGSSKNGEADKSAEKKDKADKSKKDKSGSKEDKSKKDKSKGDKDSKMDKSIEKKDRSDKSDKKEKSDKDKSSKKEKTDKSSSEKKSKKNKEEAMISIEDASPISPEGGDDDSDYEGDSSAAAMTPRSTLNNQHPPSAASPSDDYDDEDDEEEESSEEESSQQHQRQRGSGIQYPEATAIVAAAPPGSVMGRPKGNDPFAAAPRVAWCGLTLKLPTQGRPSDSSAVLRQGTNAFERFIILTDAPHPNASETPQFDSDFGQLLVCLPPPCLADMDPPRPGSLDDGSFVAKMKRLPFDKLVQAGVTRCIDVMLIDSIDIFGKSVDRATSAASVSQQQGGGDILHILDYAAKISMFPLPQPDGSPAAPQPPLALGFSSQQQQSLRSIKGITDMSSYLCSKSDGEKLLDELHRIRGEATTRYRRLLENPKQYDSDGTLIQNQNTMQQQLANRVDVPAIRVVRDGVLIGGIRQSSLDPASHDLSPKELLRNPLHPNFGSTSAHAEIQSNSGSRTAANTPLRSATMSAHPSRRHSVESGMGLAARGRGGGGGSPAPHSLDPAPQGGGEGAMSASVLDHHHHNQHNNQSMNDDGIVNEAAALGYPQGNEHDYYQSEPGAWRLRDSISHGANSPQRGLVHPQELHNQLITNQRHNPANVPATTYLSSGTRPPTGRNGAVLTTTSPAYGGVGYHDAPGQIGSSSTLPLDPHHAAETAVMARLLKQSQNRTKDLHRECEDLHARGEEMYAMVLEHQQKVVTAEKQVLAIEREKEELKAHYEGELNKVRTAFSDFDTQINAYIKTLEESHTTTVSQLKKEILQVKENASKEQDALKKKVDDARNTTRYQQMLHQDINNKNGSGSGLLGSGRGTPHRGMMMMSLDVGPDDEDRTRNLNSRIQSLSGNTKRGGDDDRSSHDVMLGVPPPTDGSGGEASEGRWISDRELKGLVQQLERYRDVTRGPVMHQHHIQDPARSSTPTHRNSTNTATAATPLGGRPSTTPLHSSHAYRHMDDSSRHKDRSAPLRHNHPGATPPSTNGGVGIRRGGTPVRSHLGAVSSVEGRLQEYRQDLQKSTSVKRSIDEYKRRVAQEQQSKLQYETSLSLLPPHTQQQHHRRDINSGEQPNTDDLTPNNNSSSAAVQQRLQRFLAGEMAAADGSTVVSRTQSHHSRQDRRSRTRHDGSSSSGSSYTSSSSGGSRRTSSSFSDSDDEKNFTLEEQEEEGDDYGGRRTNKSYSRQRRHRASRSVSSVTHTSPSASSTASDVSQTDPAIHQRRKEKRRAKKEKKKREYNHALEKYEQHKRQEGYYTDSYGTNALGDAADSKRGAGKPSPRRIEDRRTRVQMFNMPQEAYFGDVETEGSATAGRHRQRATTPNRGANNNGRQNAYHPPPRVSHPTIATPVRHDVATSRVPLVDNLRLAPGSSSAYHNNNNNAMMLPPPPSTSSQIFRGPQPSGNVYGTPRNQPHNGYTPFTTSTNTTSPNVSRRTGSPFDHRDRSIL